MVDGVDDVAADRAAVQRTDAVAGDLGIRGRQVGVGQPRPDDGQLTVREEQLAGRGELGEPGLVLARLLPESVIDDEPTAGDALGGAEIVSEAEAAIAAERPLPCHQRSGHADRQSAADRRRERERLARGRIDEQVLGGAGGCGLTSVNRRDAAAAGVVIDEVAAPTDAGDIRLSDTERGGDSDCSVGGRPALAQDAEASLGGIRTLGGDGAARADRDRVLGGRGRGRGCGDAGQARRRRRSLRRPTRSVLRAGDEGSRRHHAPSSMGLCTGSCGGQVVRSGRRTKKA